MPNRVVVAFLLPGLLIGAFLVLSGPEPARAADQDFMLKRHANIPGDYVRFGDLAEPVSESGQELWSELKDKKLWKAPRKGKRVVINRGRLQRAMDNRLSLVAERCLYPQEMVIKRGDNVLGPKELRDKVVSFLTPFVRDLGEEVEFRDFRLPEAIFLSSGSDELVLDEGSGKIKPGRNNFRIKVKDGYGEVRDTHSAGVLIDVWKTVPCTDRPLKRREPVTMDAVRFERKNLAYIRGEVWDGKSGSWMASRSMGRGECLTKD
ncbi:MAG: hypothetical protein ACLFMP_07555, partial [Desulfonatronovibrionaceae bacterium]